MNVKSSSIELNKDDPDSIYYWIANKISSHDFRNKIKNFIEDNCSIFTDDNINSFQQGVIFKNMNILLDQLLDSVYEEGNITPEDYSKSSQRGKTDEKYKKYFVQIEKFRDYLFFKDAMVKRNIELMELAEKQMNIIKNKNNNEKITQITPEILTKIFSGDENIKKLSEKEIKRIKNNEEEEMEKAIRLSLEEYKKEKEVKEKEDIINKEEVKKKEKSKRIIGPISSIIGFDYSEWENKPNANKLLNGGNNFKAISYNEKKPNDLYNFGINKSLMPAPIIEVPSSLEKKAIARDYINKNYEKNLKMEPLENISSNINLEDNKKRNDNNGNIYYLPESINENISQYNDEIQEKANREKVSKMKKAGGEQKITPQ